MKYILSVCLASLIALCAGIGFDDLPDCAKPCATSLPSQCGIKVDCICKSSEWISGISCCVRNKCSQTEQDKTVQVAQQICDTVKVTLPTAATCAASATAAATANTGSPSTAGSSTPASPTTAGSGSPAGSTPAPAAATPGGAVGYASIAPGLCAAIAVIFAAFL